MTASDHYDTSYSYDAADRLSSLTDPAGRSYGFFYDSRSDLHAIQYPNGTFAWYDLNPDGWLTGLYNRHGTLTTPLPASVPADSSSSPILDLGYAYNEQGQEVSEQRSGGGLTTTDTGYGYDDLGRLATVTNPLFTTAGTYCYDLDSNRTKTYASNNASCTDANPTATYAYSSSALDQLTSVTAGASTSYGYTSDGQVSTRGNDTLTWDGSGRNTGGTYGNTTLTYTYDPTGNLAQRTTTSPDTTTNYLLGGLFETDDTNTITTSYVTGDGIDLAHYAGPPTTSSTVSYQYDNGHGDTAATADDSGSRTDVYAYDPFGNPDPSDTWPANTTTTRYTGSFDKQTDTTSNLILMGARPYDPTTGRFLAIDPIPGGSLNNYDYAGQDPINGYDLSGTCAGVTKGSCVKALKKAYKVASTLLTRLDRAPDVFVQPDVLKPAVSTVTFSAQGGVAHGDRHVPSDTSPAAVRSAISSDLVMSSYLTQPKQGVNYRGTVTVNGRDYEYRWRYFGNGRGNVGTFYPTR